MDGEVEGGGVVEGGVRAYSAVGVWQANNGCRLRDCAARLSVVGPWASSGGPLRMLRDSRFAVGASKCLAGWVYGGGHPSKDL